jgi:hypothetical protein
MLLCFQQVKLFVYDCLETNWVKHLGKLGFVKPVADPRHWSCAASCCAHVTAAMALNSAQKFVMSFSKNCFVMIVYIYHNDMWKQLHTQPQKV